MSEIFNLLEEYKQLYENVKRDKDKYIEVMLQMKDTMDTMRDALDTMKQLVSDLKRDNRLLRTELRSQLTSQNTETIITQMPHQHQIFPVEIMDPEM